MQKNKFSSEPLVYQASNGAIELKADINEETIWANLNQVAELFGRDKSVISRHIKNIFESKELDKDQTVAIFATVQKEGEKDVTRKIEHFNLDVVISIGYRVNSKTATKFRQRATQTLRKHITQGYTINYNRIKHNYEAFLNAVDLDIPESRSEETDEIAIQKAQSAFSKIKKPLIVIDSGLFIDSLGGFPKTFINFTLKTIGIDGLLMLLQDKTRRCYFKNSLAYIDDSNKSDPVLFNDTVYGSISFEESGELKAYNWSILHKIFIPENYSQPLAAMGKKEFQSWNKTRRDNSCINSFFKWLDK